MTLAILKTDPAIRAGEPVPEPVSAAQGWLREMIEPRSRRLVRALPTTATGLAQLRKDTRLGDLWYRDVADAQRAAARGHRGLVITVEAEIASEAIDWRASLASRVEAGHTLSLVPGARVRILAVGYGLPGERRYPCRPGLIGRTMSV